MRIHTLAGVVVLGSFLLACGPSGRGDDGGGDDTNTGADGGGSGSGSNQENCTDAAKLVYVVDSNNTLSTFDPATKTFHDLGALSCPATPTVDPT